MRRAVCPGSFDPVTLGHLDVIARASALFDEVLVAVGGNPAKPGLFAPAERVELLTAAVRPWANVAVTTLTGLLVDFCAAHDAGTVVKGLRTADFDYELQMAQMNHRLAGLETVFLPTAVEWSYVSSSLVREIATLGGDVSDFVPMAVADRIRERVTTG